MLVPFYEEENIEFNWEGQMVAMTQKFRGRDLGCVNERLTTSNQKDHLMCMSKNLTHWWCKHQRFQMNNFCGIFGGLRAEA